MRKLKSRAKGVARAYSRNLLRPMGAIIARSAKVEYALSSEPSRVHPVYAWPDGADHLHIIAATPAGPVILSLWKGDVAAALKAAPFSRFQLTPDPFATQRGVETMTRQGLLPASWEADMVEDDEVSL